MMRVHISLNVASLDASVRFYSTLFGQSVSKQRPDYANFRLDQPPVHLALAQAEVRTSSSTPDNASHYGVELSGHGELEQWRSRLDDSGVRLDIEDDAACCYARADKLWLTDPDGNRWEIWVRTGEHDAMGSTQSIQQATPEACCPT